MPTHSQMTLEDLRTRFGIRVESRAFLPLIAPLPLPEWLREYLRVSGPVSPFITSEKALAECVIAPMLGAAKAHLAGQSGIFSGEMLTGAGLADVCDFVLSPNPNACIPEAPLLVVCQVGRAGWFDSVAGCVAAMVSARELNKRAANQPVATYGCLTSGTEWHFLRLENQLTYVEPSSVSFNALGQALGNLVWLIEQVRL